MNFFLTIFDEKWYNIDRKHPQNCVGVEFCPKTLIFEQKIPKMSDFMRK